jgi:acetyl esterase/lipase
VRPDLANRLRLPNLSPQDFDQRLRKFYTKFATTGSIKERIALCDTIPMGEFYTLMAFADRSFLLVTPSVLLHVRGMKSTPIGLTRSNLQTLLGIAGAAFLFAFATTKLLAEDAPEIRIWPGAAPDEPAGIEKRKVATTDDGKTIRISYVDQPTLTLYKAPQPNGTAVVVCPGGAYNKLAWNKEGTEIAEWLNTLGVTAAVLKYRVPRRDAKQPHPWPLQDARRAMRVARHHAEDWGIDPDKLGVLGFSAGGHLSVMLASHWATDDYQPIDAADQLSARPNFVIPIYPAYLGDPQDKSRLSPLVKISKDSAPMFIAITHDDSDRSIYAALLYVELKRAKVPAELHIYGKGGHGYGMRPSEHPVSTWTKRCEEWLRASKLIP